MLLSLSKEKSGMSGLVVDRIFFLVPIKLPNKFSVFFISDFLKEFVGIKL